MTFQLIEETKSKSLVLPMVLEKVLNSQLQFAVIYFR